MNKEEFLQNHWRYYLLLEEKVIDLQKYIEFDNLNMQCFSNEIMHLIISICCEIDIIFKLILEFQPEAYKTMDNYRRRLISKNEYSDIYDETLNLIENKSISLIPFKDFKTKSLNWWRAYDELKHSRITNYSKANLENLLNSLGALYILEIYYYKNEFFSKYSEENIPEKMSKLFITNILKPNFVTNLTALIVDDWEDKKDE